VVEIGIKQFARFLDQWALAMFESLATANDKQLTPCGDLHIGDLEGSGFRLLAKNILFIMHT
jgi:hypothetical protein